MATTDALVAAERAFASAAANEGTRSAFLQFLADNSIVFRPEPVDGQTWFQEQPADPGLLSWRPAYAETAASGDLGFTTGPWSFRGESAGNPIQFGQYVSVWRRGQYAPWKVAVDVGVTCPPPVDESESAPLISIQHDTPRQGVSNLELLQIEGELAAAVRREGYLIAVHKMADADVWVLRTGQPPFRGFQDLGEALPYPPLDIAWEVAGAVVAASGDLGYVYGIGHRVNGEQVEERCSFLRIWRWGDQNRWELALDIDNPIPSGTEWS